MISLPEQIYQTYTAPYRCKFVLAFIITFISCTFEISLPFFAAYYMRQYHLYGNGADDKQFGDAQKLVFIVLSVLLVISALFYYLKRQMYSKIGWEIGN